VRIRPALICCAALAFACSIQNEASAARRRLFNQSEAPATILPSREEISAVPVPEQGRMVAYPVDVVRYGLTVHPSARFVRRMMSR
jgi:hypothetical protein